MSEEFGSHNPFLGATEEESLVLDAGGMAGSCGAEEGDEEAGNDDASADEEQQGWDMAEVDNEELLKGVLQKTSRQAWVLPPVGVVAPCL